MASLEFYVYAYLREDGSPYYIGKGKDLRAWNLGKKTVSRSIESRMKQKENAKGINSGPQQTIMCPHCNKKGGLSNMKRYHFENCILSKIEGVQ